MRVSKREHPRFVEAHGRSPADAYDYVIVGGGTAGCVLANRLSRDPSCQVLLLEAGPADRSPWIHLPIGYGKTMFHDVYNWKFYTDPDPGMDDRRIYWPRGRCLGGSSSINGLIYVRGQPEDYDAWQAAGNRDWGWRDVLPYFVRSEGNSRGASDGHGADGPLVCSDIGAKHELIEAIIAGAQSLGVPRNDDFNAGSQEGVGYYQLFTRKGLRCSTATGYLRPVRRRSNLDVKTDARVTRIRITEMRACGVDYVRDGVAQSASARREVIVAAGALQSPQLLQLSGVGAGMLLQQFGIPVVLDLPGVGEN
ncbi:MAG TPA: GMC family oxidoreductase N-terminal domain-containing protein, partial [Casimicrobiaceae bacterium]|nr:GMC family oxidoreductase N-terminal domain-containing protein [Casimicrobiaceae bacterium]